MKKIYIITTAHPYNDVRVTQRVGRSFITNGFDVSWFGPSPDREPLPLYGIKFNFFKKNANKIDRYTSWLRLKRLLKGAPPADVYFAVDPDSITIANFYAKKYGSKSVFDIHEIFHKDMLSLNFPSFLIPLLGTIVKYRMRNSCKNSSLVIGVGETRIKPFIKYIKKHMIVRHCVPLEYVKGLKADPFKKGFNEILIMQGKVSHQQGTLKLLFAAKMATLITNVNVKVIVFKIFSKDLSEKIFMNFVHDNSLENNIILLDPVPFDQIFPILCKCDIGAISYQRTMGIECMPNRIFEFMAVGLPVIVPAYAVEMQKILKSYNCGLSADMEDANSIAATIVSLIKDPSQAAEFGKNGHSFFQKECNWEIESKELIDWIKN